MDRKSIKNKAKANFTSQYGVSVGVNFLYTFLVGLCGSTGIGGILITPILWTSKSRYDLKVYNGEEGKFEDMFSCFKTPEFGRSIGGYWYMALWIWLWSLLFIIPGIVKTFAYCLTPYILVDEPEIPVTEALNRSKELTKGHKWEIFVFFLSFIGWGILSSITCGLVGIFYVNPYMNVSLAGIYEELRTANPTGVHAQTANTPEQTTIDGQFK